MRRSPIPSKVQQFDLFQPSRLGPDYRALPLAVRQETVRLLARLLRAHLGRRPAVASDREALIEVILAGGRDVLRDEYRMVWFPGDDLLAACRPRGLPIGNLTSQFWSNGYLHPFDLFVKRELGCPAYLRYVDDFTLFADDKTTLWTWKAALQSRLAMLRLTIHESSAQVLPTACGIPWLGFVVYPDHCKVKARKVRHATHRLGQRYEAYCAGAITFAEFDASVQGWINHVRFADSWGLRRHVLAPFRLKPGDLRRARGAGRKKIASAAARRSVSSTSALQ